MYKSLDEAKKAVKSLMDELLIFDDIDTRTFVYNAVGTCFSYHASGGKSGFSEVEGTISHIHELETAKEIVEKAKKVGCEFAEYRNKLSATPDNDSLEICRFISAFCPGYKELVKVYDEAVKNNPGVLKRLEREKKEKH